MAAINLDSISSSNWMAALPDRARLFDLVLPGTHDTGTFAFIKLPLTFAQSLVQTNESGADYRTQLDQGVRFWDLRLVKTDGAKGDNIDLYHGPFKVSNLNDALRAAQEFLRSNPTETLVVSFKKEGGTLDFEASDIQAYLDRYGSNSSLPLWDQNLWVAGPDHFADLAASRPAKGLGGLNAAGSLFALETRNPRQEAGVLLNHGALTLGDVRGKIVLHMRDFGEYPAWSESGIVALDGGRFTAGVSMQDDYSGPGYAEKKAAIVDFAKQTVDPQKFTWNYTSATLGKTNPLHSPLSYALTINAGATKDQFKTDDTANPLRTELTPSLKTLLGSGGDLTAWNLQQKRAGASGLRGTFAGDFLLAPQVFYDDFWTGSLYGRGGLAPNLNNTARYPASDHLSQLIWRQSALYGMSFNGASIDPVLGIPVYKENSTGTLRFIPYLGDADGRGVRFAVARVDAAQAGLTSAQIASIVAAPLDDQVVVGVVGANRATRKMVRFDADTQTLTANVPRGDAGFNFSIPGTPGVDGYRFFRLDLLNPGDNTVIGAPSFFAINDL